MTENKPILAARPDGATPLGRRKFLWATAAGVAVFGATALAGCAHGGHGAGQEVAGPSGPPKRGGILHLGGQGGASTDSLDAQNAVTNTDFCRVYQLYDGLVVLDAQGQPKLSLAKSITPNADATVWTITIAAGVTTHQGKPFTADDVLFSLNRIVTNKFPGAYSLGPIDLAGAKVVNPTTLTIPFAKPYAILPDVLSSGYYLMVPRGYDPNRPDGTGPFQYQSFTPGVASTFVRNNNYWQNGLPYLDAVVTTNIADETSQINALQSGQVDVVNYLSDASVAALQNGGMHVTIAETGGWGPITLRTDQKPFNDVRVRQALRLIVDRQQLLNQVFGAKGKLGNDVFGVLDKSYPVDLPQREQDIDQARSLLKAAGADDLKFDLPTTSIAPGMVQAAQVFATQAKQAGVNVNVVQQTPTDYFANTWLKSTVGQDYWATLPYLVTAGQCLVPGSPFNWCQFNDAEYNALYGQAIAQLDESKRADLIHRLARIDYERGCYIIPYFFPTIGASSPKLGGVEQSANGFSPGGNDFANFWLA